MFQVQCLKSTTNKVTESYSKYSIGPFIKGQSTTIGNALRRVLLSNLPGLAITGVRISGIDHEFSTIPNVKEDVVDILLNLKQIILTPFFIKFFEIRLKSLWGPGGVPMGSQGGWPMGSQGGFQWDPRVGPW